MCVCVCVCVCERERKRERENGGGGGGGRKRVCVNFVSFAGISTSVKNMSLKRRVLSQRNPDPPICSHYNLRRHMEYIFTLNSLSLSHQIHTFSRFYYRLCSYGHPDRNSRCVCVCVCVCVCMRERERMGGGGGRKSLCVCVNFVSFAGISTSVKNMSLKRRVLSQRNPDPSSCSHYNFRKHMEYILTPTSLSLSPKYTHFLGFTIGCVVMVIQTETVDVCVRVRVRVCVCVCERERENGGEKEFV